MRIPSWSGRRRARIEIIPLIDIMFFLLATFVMVSLSMIKNLGIPVHLPVAASGAAQELKSYVTVTVTQGGKIYLDKKSVRLKELASELTRRKRSEPNLQIFLQGDEEAPFGSVTHLLDEIRLLGITRVSIQIRHRESQEIDL